MSFIRSLPIEVLTKLSAEMEPIEVLVLLGAGEATEISAPVMEVDVLLGASLLSYLYVVDSGNNRVQAFDYQGNFKFSFGSYGTGNGQFITPYGVTTDGTYVYVTDTGNNRVQYFTPEGVYVGQFGSVGTDWGKFQSPKGIATDGGYVFVIDQFNHRFQIFTMGGMFVYGIGEYGSGTNQFAYPTDIAVDELYIYIDDTGNSRIVIYEKNIYSGAIANITLPKLTLSASGACRGAFCDLQLPSPSLILNATGFAGGVGHGDIALPTLSLSASGGLTLLSGGGALSIPALTLRATGLAGGVGNGNIRMPGLTVSAIGISGGIGQGGIVLPSVTLAAVGHEVGVGQGAIILPALTLTAFGISGIVTTTYSGIVVNLKTKAITEYVGYNFNGLVEFEDKLYGVNENGIFLLEGGKDNTENINAHIKTGIQDFHKNGVRKIRHPYLVWRSDGQASLTVEEDEDDGFEYPIDDPNAKIHDTRVKIARGYDGREYAFKFSNKNGSDFDLISIRVPSETVSYRVR